MSPESPALTCQVAFEIQCCSNSHMCCPRRAACCPSLLTCCPSSRWSFPALQAFRDSQGMRVELDCPWTPVPGGLRLLAPDGRSFRLRGVRASYDGHVDVPADVANRLHESGMVTMPTGLRVAVVSDDGVSQDIVRGLEARRIEVTTWMRGRQPGSFRDLRCVSGASCPVVHVVVICPRTLLGGRDIAEQCHRAGVPSVIAWGRHRWGVLGPINDHHPGCQHCADMALAARDPDWVTMARTTTGDSHDPAVTAWLVNQIEAIAGALRDDSDVYRAKSVQVRTNAGERSLVVPAQPGCHCWPPQEASCNTLMRSAA
ncbi:hypothetical protein [Cutibacterium avidum]|uniref:hypothetical protein n=1 Tax=Cutibacterium avidum TaxID=33010 RepID=UPI003B00286F